METKKYDKIKKKMIVTKWVGGNLQMDPINISGELKKPLTARDTLVDTKIPQQEEPTIQEDISIPPVKNQNSLDGLKKKMMLADLVSSLAPSVIAMARGASPIALQPFLSSGNKYAQTRAASDIPTKANTTTIENAEGMPESIMAKDMEGTKPYYQPRLAKGISSAGVDKSGNVQGNLKLYDPELKEHRTFTQLRNGKLLYPGTTEEVSPDKARKMLADLGVGTTQGTDYTGSKSQSQYDKNAPKGTLNTIKGYSSLGGIMGGLSKEEAQSRVKDAAKAKKEGAVHQATVDEVTSMSKETKTTKDPMVFSAITGKALRKMLENKLSDDEQRLALGNNYKTQVELIKNWASGKIRGEIPDSLRNNVVNLLDYIGKREKSLKESKIKSYTDKAGLSLKGKKIIESTSGSTEAPTDKNAWKKNWKEL